GSNSTSPLESVTPASRKFRPIGAFVYARGSRSWARTVEPIDQAQSHDTRHGTGTNRFILIVPSLQRPEPNCILGNGAASHQCGQVPPFRACLSPCRDISELPLRCPRHAARANGGAAARSRMRPL